MSHKLRIGLDVDGVLRNFVGALRREYAKDYPKHRVKKIDKWDFSDSFPIGKDIWTYAFETRIREIFTGADQYSYASGLTKWLKSQGHEIWIITTQKKGTEHFTLEWLKKNDIRYDHIVFTCDKHRIDCHVLLDDNVVNLEDFKTSLTGTPICMSRPWNNDWTGQRVVNLKDFQSLISVIKTWSDLERVTSTR